LDERKLVEALAGEKNVFKKLSSKADSSATGTGKFYIDFLLDCSASMYRFNSYDQRLNRMLECCTLIMEAFAGADSSKFEVTIHGHSGENSRIELVEEDHFPRNVKERYDVLERIVANSQYTWAGDCTFQGVQESINHLQTCGSKFDERQLFVVSDANFSRYNLSPKKFAQLLQSNPQVKASAIFIGSLGEEAAALQSALGKDKGFVCLRTHELPNILSSNLKKSVKKTTL
jgi:hypothetical protein